MPEPVVTSVTPSPTAGASDLLGAATRFAEQLRAATPGQTVNLGAMVTARLDGRTVSAAGAAGAVGLGAMTQTGGVGRAAVARPLTGDAAKADRVVRFALSQQGKPYVFGTSGPDTFDCSGLVSAAYKQIGVEVPAYTFAQATYGRGVDPKTEPIRAGDLILVRGGRPATDLGHVGIAISATEWIQAPRTGDVVKTGPLPYDRIQVVRRLVGS